MGALIAGVYELRDIAKADCTHFSNSGDFYVTLTSNGVSGNNPFSFYVNKTCAMLKACFAFGIMNIIFFASTSFLLLFMKRSEEKEVVVKETYRRRSHDSRYVVPRLSFFLLLAANSMSFHKQTWPFPQWLRPPPQFAR